MTIEVPVLRLGLAGYSEAQQKAAVEAAAAAARARARWEGGACADADAGWLEGSRTKIMAFSAPGGRVHGSRLAVTKACEVPSKMKSCR